MGSFPFFILPWQDVLNEVDFEAIAKKVLNRNIQLENKQKNSFANDFWNT